MPSVPQFLQPNYNGATLVKLLFLLLQHGNCFPAAQFVLKQDKIAQRIIDLYRLCNCSTLGGQFTDI